MVSLELFHLSKATKYNKKWGQEMKSRKVHLFPPFFCFPSCCHTLNLMQNQCSNITNFLFLESPKLLTLKFNPVMRNHEKRPLPCYISKILQDIT